MVYFLWKIFRPCYCFLYERNVNDWSLTRCIVNYFCGVFVAVLLWHLLLVNFCFSMETNFKILAVLVVVIGVGYVFTSSVKCLTLLMLAGIVGRSGRSYLRAISFAYVIAGPVTNLASNGGEVVRVFACATTLTYNLTKTRLDLMTKPFQNTAKTMKDDIKDVQQTFANISNVLEPIHQEVEGDDTKPNNNASPHHTSLQSADVQQRYKEKFERRCKGQLAQGVQRCRDAFGNAHTKCEDIFPIIIRTLLCWPFHIDFVCDIEFLGDPREVCNPGDAIPNTFGESYAELTMTQDQLFQNGSNMKVSYKIEGSVVKEAKQKAEGTAKKVMKEFRVRKQIFDAVMSIMEVFLSFLFIRVISSAITYHGRYKREIDFDNLYISNYFRHVDDRRKRANKRHLLPLRKFERKYFVDLSRACQHTKEELRAVLFYLVQFTLEILAGCFFLLLDYLVVGLLNIIRMKSLISYVQEGEHVIHFHVNGTGLMARLLRKTLYNFNMHERVSTYLTNEVCLPRPTELPTIFYIKLMLLYATVVLLIYKSTFFLRLRRMICAYFYHRREKKRILFLYNNLLVRRRAMFEMMVKNAEEHMATQKVRRDVNPFLKLRLRNPVRYGWLKCLNSARLKCLICDETEDDNFIICPNVNCGMSYCNECWDGLGAICVACKTLKHLPTRESNNPRLYTKSNLIGSQSLV